MVRQVLLTYFLSTQQVWINLKNELEKRELGR